MLETLHTEVVVQGSGIGPVMFLIFIDELARLLEYFCQWC